MPRCVKLGEHSWHLEIPASAKRGYRLAQLDDHGSLRRGDFPWKPPLTLSLQARVSSAAGLPGTWGFGLWNDPFSFMIAYNKVVPRFPALPDAAWFFYASPQNYLSFRDDLPASGFLAATFSSSKVPLALLALASPSSRTDPHPRAAQLCASLRPPLIRQDATQIHTNVTDWHAYSLEWEPGWSGSAWMGRRSLRTRISPQVDPLSLVIWIDNQYAALPPAGRLQIWHPAQPRASLDGDQGFRSMQDNCFALAKPGNIPA